MIDLALTYASRGWPVFPIHSIRAGACSCGRSCSSPGKHPLTRNGLKDASTDPARVAEWWGKSPGANIGFATGRIYVIDLDGVEGMAAWDYLEMEHGEAPTLTARTGGGGIHRYYTMPEGLILPNTARVLGARIDTRGQGGYVLVPTSNHMSGGFYAWVSEIALMMLPRWIVSRLQPRLPPQPPAPPTLSLDGTPYGNGVMNGSLTRIRQAPEGARNQTLVKEAFIVGQYVAGGEINPRGVADALLAAAPDPDVKKSADTIKRALQDGCQYPRRKRDDS